MAPYLPTTLFVQKAALELSSRWRNKELSNFEYLMALNRLSGRTYNDLSQYPVFPWVLKNYSSKSIDLNDPSNYRDLAYPIGAQTPQRRSTVREKYSMLVNLYSERPEGGVEAASSDDQPLPLPSLPRRVSAEEAFQGTPWMYGVHYLNPATVAWYLLRLEPFTSYHIVINDGRFDRPDRQFHSISAAYHSATSNDADVKELTPEFYYLPDFLRNMNGASLGSRQRAEPVDPSSDVHASSINVVDDVVLPPWASSPEAFIAINRAALESPFVTSKLHLWVDLIFGHKQKGPFTNGGSSCAVAACNLYHSLMYEGTVNLAVVEARDTFLAKKLTTFIDNYGNIPMTLFELPIDRVDPRTKRFGKVATSASNLPNAKTHKHRANGLLECEENDPNADINPLNPPHPSPFSLSKVSAASSINLSILSSTFFYKRPDYFRATISSSSSQFMSSDGPEKAKVPSSSSSPRVKRYDRKVLSSFSFRQSSSSPSKPSELSESTLTVQSQVPAPDNTPTFALLYNALSALHSPSTIVRMIALPSQPFFSESAVGGILIVDSNFRVSMIAKNATDDDFSRIASISSKLTSKILAAIQQEIASVEYAILFPPVPCSFGPHPSIEANPTLLSHAVAVTPDPAKQVLLSAGHWDGSVRCIPIHIETWVDHMRKQAGTSIAPSGFVVYPCGSVPVTSVAVGYAPETPASIIGAVSLLSPRTSFVELPKQYRSRGSSSINSERVLSGKNSHYWVCFGFLDGLTRVYYVKSGERANQVFEKASRPTPSSMILFHPEIADGSEDATLRSSILLGEDDEMKKTDLEAALTNPPAHVLRPPMDVLVENDPLTFFGAVIALDIEADVEDVALIAYELGLIRVVDIYKQWTPIMDILVPRQYSPITNAHFSGTAIVVSNDSYSLIYSRGGDLVEIITT
jgi:Beige/BEACH domain